MEFSRNLGMDKINTKARKWKTYNIIQMLMIKHLQSNTHVNQSKIMSKS